MMSNAGTSCAGADAPRDLPSERELSARKRKAPESSQPSELSGDEDGDKYRILDLFKKSLKRQKEALLDASVESDSLASVNAPMSSTILKLSPTATLVLGTQNPTPNISIPSVNINARSVPRSSAARSVRKVASLSSMPVVAEVLPQRIVCSIVEGDNKAVRYFSTAQEVAECLSVRVDKVLTVLRGIRQSLNGLNFRYQEYTPAPLVDDEDRGSLSLDWNSSDALTIEQIIKVASGAKGVRGATTAVVMKPPRASDTVRAAPIRRPAAAPGSRTAIAGVRSANPFGCKAVSCIDVESGHIIKQFESIAAASRSLHVGSSQLSACCLGKIKTAYGFRWQYDTSNSIPRGVPCAPVQQAFCSAVQHQELNLFDIPGVTIRIPVQIRAAPLPAGAATGPDNGSETSSAAHSVVVNEHEMDMAELCERIRAFRATGQPIGAKVQPGPHHKLGQTTPAQSHAGHPVGVLGGRVVECILLPNAPDDDESDAGSESGSASNNADTITVLHRFKTVNEAARLLRVGHSNILKCCRGQASSAYGFRWRYHDLAPSSSPSAESLILRRDDATVNGSVDGDEDTSSSMEHYQYNPLSVEELAGRIHDMKEAQAEAEREADRQLMVRKVSCLYFTDRVLECKFNSLADAASLLNLNATHIQKCCNMNDTTNGSKEHALTGLRFFFTPSRSKTSSSDSDNSNDSNSDGECETETVTVDPEDIEAMRTVLKRHAHKVLFTRVPPGADGGFLMPAPRPNPPNTGFQVLCLVHGDPSQTVIYRFASVSAVERELKISFKKVSKCCKGVLEHMCGLRFIYAADVQAVVETEKSTSPGMTLSTNVAAPEPASEAAVGHTSPTTAVKVEERSPLRVDESKFLLLSEVQALVQAYKMNNPDQYSATVPVASSSTNPYIDARSASMPSSNNNGSHPVCCANASDPSNKIIHRFNSLGSASRQLRVSSRRIAACCKAGGGDVFGLNFMYAADVEVAQLASDGSDDRAESSFLSIDDLLAIVDLYRPANQVSSYYSSYTPGIRTKKFIRRATGEIVIVDLNVLASRRRDSVHRRLECSLPEFNAWSPSLFVFNGTNAVSNEVGVGTDGKPLGTALAPAPLDVRVPVNSANTLLKVFPGAMEAAAQLRLPYSGILDCCIFEELYGQGMNRNAVDGSDSDVFCPGSVFFGGLFWRFASATTDCGQASSRSPVTRKTGSQDDKQASEDEEEEEEYELCTMILCDRCNDEFPLESVGLKVIPEGNWYCLNCRRSPQEPSVARSLETEANNSSDTGMVLEISHEDRNNGHFCALSCEAMLKLKVLLAPPEASQPSRGWVPGSRRSSTVYFKLWYVCSKRSDTEEERKERFASAQEAIAGCSYIPTGVDVVNLCIYGGVDMKGNTWSFEREVLEPDFQSSEEEEEEVAEAEADDDADAEAEAEYIPDGMVLPEDPESGSSRHATRLLRPKRFLASVVQSEEYADVKPITLHNKIKAPEVRNNSATNSTAFDMAMFGCTRSSKFTLTVSDDSQVTEWPEIRSKEELLSDAAVIAGRSLLLENCIYTASEQDPSDVAISVPNRETTDAFLVDAMDAQCLFGAIVHCYFPAEPNRDKNVNGNAAQETVTDLDAGKGSTRQSSKLVTIISEKFSVDFESAQASNNATNAGIAPSASQTPAYLAGYVALLNQIYGGGQGEGEDNVGDSLNGTACASNEGNSDDMPLKPIPATNQAPGRSAVTRLQGSRVVYVFDGCAVLPVAVSRLSGVLSVDKLLEIYRSCGYDAHRACELVRAEALAKVYNCQWTYSDLCYYIAARNYYSTGAHKLPQFPNTCAYLVYSYTFMDVWDRLLTLSGRTNTGTTTVTKDGAASNTDAFTDDGAVTMDGLDDESLSVVSTDMSKASPPKPWSVFTRSFAETIEFHFNCMNRAGDFAEEKKEDGAAIDSSKGSATCSYNEVEHFDSNVVKTYLHIFFVADAIKRALLTEA